MSGSRRAELSANRQFKTLIEPEKLSKQPGPPLTACASAPHECGYGHKNGVIAHTPRTYLWHTD